MRRSQHELLTSYFRSASTRPVRRRRKDVFVAYQPILENAILPQAADLAACGMKECRQSTDWGAAGADTSCQRMLLA